MTLMCLGPVVIVLSLSHGGVSGGMDVAVAVVLLLSCCRHRPACRRVVVLVVWMCGCCCHTRIHQCAPTVNTGKCRSGAEVIDGHVYIVVVK
jgi:hypothetical protein